MWRPRDDSDELADAHQRWESALETRAAYAHDYTLYASKKPTSGEHRKHLRKLMKEAMEKWRIADAAVDARMEDCNVIERRIAAARRGE